mmetsp:Transcript_36234/g.31970  ORF Transcript_36234/g.31970 Transcript_36234/m.31970 type:complete len:308 (-) Transcript_36234:242-1165(-)
MSKLCLWPIITLIVFGVALYFNYGAATGQFSDKDVGEVSDEYNLEITPASWTFSIWGFIYTWQAIWIIYVLYLTCKYDMNSIVFGKWFYIIYNIANICNGLWIIVWTNELIWPAAIFLPCIAAGLVISAYIAHKYMFVDSNTMIVNNGDNYGGVANNNRQSEYKWLDSAKSIRPLLYIFVLNGVPFYATWTVTASHLNIGIALCHKAGMTNTNASFLMLSILTCVILFYWYLDFYRLRQYLQYTYSPYIVLIVAFSGILSNGGLNTKERPSSAFVLALLIIACLGTIAKVVMGITLRNKPVQSFQNV